MFTAVNIAQFFIAMIAIALSVVFFLSAKKAEREASNALEAIKAQTKTLSDITSRQMSRLIKNVTEQKPVEDILKIIVTMGGLKAPLGHELKTQEVEQLTATAIEGFLGSYYYCMITNILTQYLLPYENDYYSGNDTHKSMRDIMDLSNRDFHNIDNVIKKIDSTRIQTNLAYSYYQAVVEGWGIYVLDAETFWKEHPK